MYSNFKMSLCVLQEIVYFHIGERLRVNSTLEEISNQLSVITNNLFILCEILQHVLQTA